jgi:hypothetical protein
MAYIIKAQLKQKPIACHSELVSESIELIYLIDSGQF